MPNAKYYFFLVLLRVMNPQFFGTSGYSLSSPSPLPITERMRRLQMHYDHVPHTSYSASSCFHHHHLHEEGPPLRMTWPSPRSTSRRTGWKIPQIPQKQKPKNFSRHLYYLKMQITLELNRIPGVPIPFSLWETLPFWPPVLPRQPSPEKKVQKLWNKEWFWIVVNKKTSACSLSILFSKDASVCLSLSTFCSTWIAGSN